MQSIKKNKYKMIKREKIVLSLLVILLTLPNASKEDNVWLYERNKKLFYTSAYKICQANITYNYPYTPIIVGSFLNQAILSYYHYIYLIFEFPKNQTQRAFYLEAYDINNDKTLISKGDCYFINITNIYEYELRIYKEVIGSYIQIKFLGLNPQFFMKVNIKLARDLSIYSKGIMLTKENSLNKSNIPELKDIKDDQKIINQNKRKIQAVETSNKILLKLFGKTLNWDIEGSQNIFTQMIPVSPFLLVTVSFVVGYEDSTENYFGLEDDETVLSNFLSVHGGIELESHGFSILGGNLEANNLILKLIQLYNKKVNDALITIGLDNEVFSVTISASIINSYATMTFRFYDPVTNRIYYEIQIKIELKFKYVFKLALATQEALSKAVNKAAEFDKKYGKDLDKLILAMILGIIIFSLSILVAPVAAGAIGAAIGGGVTVAINEIIKIVQNLNLEFPIKLIPQFIN